MELPVELQSLLALGVASLVTFVLTQLAKFGFDFSGYKSQLVAALVSAVIVVINALLAKIPADFSGIVTAAFQVLVIVLGAFGIHGLYKQVKK